MIRPGGLSDVLLTRRLRGLSAGLYEGLDDGPCKGLPRKFLHLRSACTVTPRKTWSTEILLRLR